MISCCINHFIWRINVVLFFYFKLLFNLLVSRWSQLAILWNSLTNAHRSYFLNRCRQSFNWVVFLAHLILLIFVIFFIFLLCVVSNTFTSHHEIIDAVFTAWDHISSSKKCSKSHWFWALLFHSEFQTVVTTSYAQSIKLHWLGVTFYFFDIIRNIVNSLFQSALHETF